MKKLLGFIAIAAIMTACNNAEKTDTTITTDTLNMEANKMADSASMMMNNAMDTSRMMVDTAVNKMDDKMHNK